MLINFLLAVILLQCPIQCPIQCPAYSPDFFKLRQSSNTIPDVVLYSYHGNRPDERVMSQCNKLHNIKRSIVYPDDYVIVMIPKSQYKNLKQKMGSTLLKLSPEFGD